MSSHDPYVPVAHSLWTDHWRVPVWVEGDVYRVSLGAGTYRYYTDETLPDEIKAVFAMIGAFPPNDVPVWSINPTNAFINNQDEKLNTIGWRVSRYLYIVIMSRELMEELYGQDTRGTG